MVSLNFQLIRQAESRARLGESPVWDPETGDLWWVDITGKRVFRMDANTRDIRYWATPEYPGFVVLTGSNRPAIGMQTGVFSFDPGSAIFARLVPFDRDGHRFNDATVDQLGRLWTSTMALDGEAGVASIQIVTDDLALEHVVHGLTIPNGLALDLERGRLFYSDSHPDIRTIWVRQLESGLPIAGQVSVFATTKALKGRPDGATLDERGFYWIAGVDGAGLYIFDLQGQLHAVIPVPFPAPTKVSFFGSDGRSIAVTSKGIGDHGGYLALADMPEAFAPGVAQPYWKAGAEK